MSRDEELQTTWSQYQTEHGHIATGTREAVKWAIEKGILQPPTIDPVDILSGWMGRALRNETIIDGKGRKVRKNYPAKIGKDGVQYSLWAEGEFASDLHMKTHFQQRREGIVSDCYKFKQDVDSYNDAHPQFENYQLVLDYTADVAEREVMNEEYSEFDDEFDEAA